MYTVPMVKPSAAEPQRYLDAWTRHLAQVRSLITLLFDGMFARVRICALGHESFSCETFRTLSLHFPANADAKSKLHLGHMIAEFNAPEQLEARCEQCADATANQTLTSTAFITHFPPVLMLHLARFKSFGDGDEWEGGKIKRANRSACASSTCPTPRPPAR